MKQVKNVNVAIPAEIKDELDVSLITWPREW
jgi:hypothetical protein